ncbi:MAG TPA: 2-phospho-L-lactate transferase [Porticoccaceae bacterium]|nr:2-phospho-L-lactate transferase [Porticoccaceae bacterium]
MSETPRVLALCGGVGGAKLALGFYRMLGPALTLVVNTGDDFTHLGLRICPDLDTVTYTLAGRVNPETGWGRADDSGRFMAAVTELGGEDWFFLGDRDLALHVERTRRLAEGESLSAVTAAVAAAFGITARVLPMSDQPVATQVETDAGTLAFQEYFVRERCRPALRGLHYRGAAQATPHPDLLAALVDPALAAIVICPSNPWLSIDPLLALPGVRAALAAAPAPVVAVSPIVGGQALKGPTAKIMAELGLEVSARTIADHYGDFLDCLLLDHGDAALAADLPGSRVAATVMRSEADKIALAAAVLEAARDCRGGKGVGGKTR